MQSLSNKLYEALLSEAADKQYKTVFGQPITYGPRVIDKLNKLGMNDDHKYDRFVILDDGNMTYTNSKRLVEVTAKIHPTRLNRIVKPDEMVSIIKFADKAECTFDICEHPYHLLRAVLNALTVGTYHSTPAEVVLDDIDYTTGDFAKDKCYAA